jgi:uncharacterized RDD family membrane protein YckC
MTQQPPDDGRSDEHGQPVPPPYGRAPDGSAPYGSAPYGSAPPPPPYGSAPYGSAPAAGHPSAPGTFTEPFPFTIPGMGLRLVARILDGIIVGIPFTIVYLIAFAGAMNSIETDPVTGEVTDASGGAFAAMFGVLALLAVLSLLYEVAFIALKGATPGKMALKVKVVRATDGQLPGWGPSVMRWLIPFIGSLVCGIGQLVVYISPFFDNTGRQQGWHDKAAHTQVIRA